MSKPSYRALRDRKSGERSEEVPQIGLDDQPFRALFEEALVGLGVADMQGNLLAFNDAMLVPGGYTREDIDALGNVARLYANAEDRDRVLGLVRAQGYVWREEVQFVRKDGTAYDTYLTLTPVRFLGQPCLYATVEDITEQKRVDRERRALEQQLWKARKMEAVGQMTAGIAHDFNNLLAIISTGCDLTGLTLESDPEEAKDHLDGVRAAAQRGSAMIKKLLGFSRTASVQVAPTDLGALVIGMREMLRTALPPEIELSIQSPGECVAVCDQGAVEQMVLNLVTNARDALPDGGEVHVTVSLAGPGGDGQALPAWMRGGPFTRISVRDTGIGMDEATRSRAFEPFFTTKPPGVGTGLGLSMVFGLAKQQGGYFDLESAPGEGTTASLYFPTAAG